MEQLLQDIEPFILVSHKGFSWYHYLHIKGGTGLKNGLGGQYKFYLFYLSPDQEKQFADLGIAADKACEQLGIPCGVGETIEAAHTGFLKQLENNPLK